MTIFKKVSFLPTDYVCLCLMICVKCVHCRVLPDFKLFWSHLIFCGLVVLVLTVVVMGVLVVGFNNQTNYAVEVTFLLACRSSTHS